MKVNIWHGCDINDGEFFPVSVKAMLTGGMADMYIYAYSYEDTPPKRADQNELLNRTWRLNNMVVGDEYPARYGSRSLSVGDIFHIEGEFTAKVDSVGFTVLDENQLAEFLERQR